MNRAFVAAASAAALSFPAVGVAQTEPSTAVAAEIKALQLRVAALEQQKLVRQLRARVAQLEAELATSGSTTRVEADVVTPPTVPEEQLAVVMPKAVTPAEPPSIVVNQTVTPKPDDGKAGLGKNEDDPPSSSENKSGGTKLSDLPLGAGIGFTYDLGRRDRIREAVLSETGLVRVSRTENVRARIVFDAHYFFKPRGSFLGLENTVDKNNKLTNAEWGFGPFVAVQPGTDEVIDAIGGGLMLGLKRKSEADDPSSFNIGIGVMYDLNAQVLGDGIVENQALPEGEKQIRYENTSQSGLLLMTSFSF